MVTRTNLACPTCKDGLAQHITASGSPQLCVVSAYFSMTDLRHFEGCIHLRQGSSVFIGTFLSASYQNYEKTAQLMFTVFDGKVTREPWKKPLDFGGNPVHITLGLWLWLGESHMMHDTPRHWLCLPNVCLTVTVLQDQRPWQRYALY